MLILAIAAGVWLGIMFAAGTFIFLSAVGDAYRKAQRTRQPFWRMLIGA